MHNQGVILWAGGAGKNDMLQDVGEEGGVGGEGLARVLEDQSFFFY